MAKSASWLVRRVPWEVWAGVVACALFVGAWAGVAGYGQSRYAAGRKSVQDGVRFDTLIAGVARKADSAAKAHTDTIVKRLTVTRWKVDTLIRQVPDSLKAVPEIAELVSNTYTLTAQIDTLTRTLDVERAVSRLRASTDSAAIVAASIVISRVTDENTELHKRPTRKAQVITGATGTVIGAVLGVILLRE